MASIKSIIAKLESKHASGQHLLNPAATPLMLDAFEQQTGFNIPSDMREFYLAHNGGYLFSNPPEEIGCFRAPSGVYFDAEIVPIERIRTTRWCVYGKESDKYGPPNCFVFCDYGDSFFVGIELDKSRETSRVIRDIDHEGYPDEESCEGIAKSFTDFMSKLVKQEDGLVFWLGED